MSNSEQLGALYRAAQATREKAYAPYSKFKVGAAVVANNGETFVGCNVENAAYPEGVCAEAGAISAMIAAGQQKIDAVMIASTSDKPCAPCGGCRQKILEFAHKDTQIHMGTDQGDIKTVTLAELLPLAFDAEDIA